MDNFFDLDENFIANDLLGSDYGHFDPKEKDDLDPFNNFGVLDSNMYASTINDVYSRLNEPQLTFGDELSKTDEENMFDMPPSSSTSDENSSLWSDESTSFPPSFEDFQPNPMSSIWDSMDSDTHFGSLDFVQGGSQAPSLPPERTIPSPNPVRRHVTKYVRQPIYMPSPVMKMVAMPYKTTVQDAIKATGIGQHTRPIRITDPKRFVIKPAEPKINFIKPMMLGKPLQSIIKVDHEDDDEDWDKDMPVLVPEAPFPVAARPRVLIPQPRWKEAIDHLCIACQRTFGTRHALVKHMHLHEQPKYQCTVCFKTFSDRTKLRRHHLVHTGEKKFKCTVCQKAFNLNSNLSTHMKTHDAGIRRPKDKKESSPVILTID